MKNDDDLELDISGLHMKGRYAVGPNGYVFDRRLFRAFSLVVVLILGITFFKLGGFGAQYAYAACPEDAIGGFCDNPLYGKCGLPACEREYLLPGDEIGERPPTLTTPFIFIIVALLIVLYLNHMGQDKPGYEEARKNAERNSNKRINRQRQAGVNKTPTRQTKGRPKR